jgi:hypothetical protein
MATKDISDIQVLAAYQEMNAERGSTSLIEHADVILQRMTGEPEKVCFCAMERAFSRGLVEYDMWLRGGWITEKGRAMLQEQEVVKGPLKC